MAPLRDTMKYLIHYWLPGFSTTKAERHVQQWRSAENSHAGLHACSRCAAFGEGFSYLKKFSYGDKLLTALIGAGHSPHETGASQNTRTRRVWAARYILL